MKFPKIEKEMITKEKVWWLIKTKKATTMSEIAKILKKRKSTIHQHLSELLDEGIIHKKIKRGKKQEYYTRLKKIH